MLLHIRVPELEVRGSRDQFTSNVFLVNPGQDLNNGTCASQHSLQTPQNCNCILSKCQKYLLLLCELTWKRSYWSVFFTRRQIRIWAHPEAVCQWADMKWNESVRELRGRRILDSWISGAALKFSSRSFEALISFQSLNVDVAAAECFSISTCLSADCWWITDSLLAGSSSLRWNSAFTLCGVAGRCCRQLVPRGPTWLIVSLSALTCTAAADPGR